MIDMVEAQLRSIAAQLGANYVQLGLYEYNAERISGIFVIRSLYTK